MPTIVSFYQHFPDEAPPMNLSIFEQPGYTAAENTHRDERCFEADACEVSDGDGQTVLTLDVRIRPRGGEIEVFPRVKLTVLREGTPFQLRRMELCAGDTQYTILPDSVQRCTLPGGCLESLAIPLGKVGMRMLRKAAAAEDARWLIHGAQDVRTLTLTPPQKAAILRFCRDCDESAVTYQPAFLWYKDYCTKD